MILIFTFFSFQPVYVFETKRCLLWIAHSCIWLFCVCIFLGGVLSDNLCLLIGLFSHFNTILLLIYSVAVCLWWLAICLPFYFCALSHAFPPLFLFTTFFCIRWIFSSVIILLNLFYYVFLVLILVILVLTI